MNLTFKTVSNSNRTELLNLQLAPGQEGFVESVRQCLAEAAQRKNWRPVGIYDGDILVGFAMYGYFLWEYFPIGKFWLNRFMIDADCQGRGYGKTALKGLITRLQLEYHCSKIYLSIIPENIAAEKLYRQFGFQFNGKRDIHGEHIMVLKF